MKIRLISDIHSEFFNSVEEFTPYWNRAFPSLETDAETVACLAGDIGAVCSKTGLKLIEFILRDCSSRFKKVIYIMGNHEYYGSCIPRAEEKIAARVADLTNVTVTSMGAETVDGHRIISATLWTDFKGCDPLVMWDAKMKMNDYKKIRTPGYASRLTPEYILGVHRRHLAFIENQLKEFPGALVMTHHAPHEKSIDPRFANDSLNYAYVNSLGRLFNEYDIGAWLHGHSHMAVKYSMGDSTVWSNPVGYPSEYVARAHYTPSLIIEL